MSTSIYALCDPVSGELRYIGKSTKPTVRIKQHISNARNGQRLHCSNWIKSIGFSPVLQILAIVPDELAAEMEKLMISYYRSHQACELTNLTDGGEGVTGHRHSPETRMKMSEKAKLRTPRRGWHCSEESKAKMRLAKLGKKQKPEHIAKAARAMVGHAVSAETRAKLSLIHTGRAMSPEWRAKLSAWQVGKKLSPETRKKMSLSALRFHAAKVDAAKALAAPPPVSSRPNEV